MDFFRTNSGMPAPLPKPVPQSHPYSPQHITIPGYQANDKQTMELLMSFSAVWFPVFLATWGVASLYGKSLRTLDKLTMMWFTLCRMLPTDGEQYAD
jgi:hypothetical protein